ncbi:hypothetical protein TNCV_3629841 [Trichonephila clavipes]|nr:hypothetical protein TNCV_3629841 [Trichonephila clavipes]
MIINNVINFKGCLCYRCDITTQETFVAAAEIIQEKAYLSTLGRGLIGKVSLNERERDRERERERFLFIGKVDSAFHPFRGLIKEQQARLRTKHWEFRVRLTPCPEHLLMYLNAQAALSFQLVYVSDLSILNVHFKHHELKIGVEYKQKSSNYSMSSNLFSIGMCI